MGELIKWDGKLAERLWIEKQGREYSGRRSDDGERV